MDYTIRNATLADLPEILRVEESWPEAARAPREKFVARIEKFPQGFFVAERDGEMLATITACPIAYDPAHPKRLSSWDAVTNHGFLHDIGDLSGYNTVYIVSGVIVEAHRGGDIFERMVLTEVELARRMGYRYVIGGAVMPGYARYCERHGAIPAGDYALLRRGHHLADPLLDRYARIGFRVPDRDHVIAEYFPDDASLNNGALVVHTV
jgi:hypothetical protein